MKTINEKTLLEVVETLERDSKNNAYNYGEEISDDYQNRINELKQSLTPPTADEMMNVVNGELDLGYEYFLDKEDNEIHIRNKTSKYPIFIYDIEQNELISRGACRISPKTYNVVTTFFMNKGDE